jgi:hypothetical protein
MNKNEQLQEMRDVYDERFHLMMERVAEISVDAEMPAPFRAYFQEVATLLRQAMETYVRADQHLLINDSLEECRQREQRFYDRLEPDKYRTGFLNPAYAVKMMGKDLGQLLSALYADMMSVIPAAYELRMDLLCIWSELFVQVYGNFAEEFQEQESPEEFSEESTEWIAKNVQDVMYWFYHDYQEIFVPDVTLGTISTDYDFMYNSIMFADLSDDRYLYQYGSPIGSNELRLAAHLRKMTQEEIWDIAHTYTEGYRKGFEITGRDLSRKKTVRIEGPIGFERVMREAIRQFKEMGLHATISREAVTSFQGRGGGKRGIYSTSKNPQFDYDHKDDRAIYFDKAFVERRLEVLRDTFEKHKTQAALYGGPAVIEVFGEEPFSPQIKPERITYTKKQDALNVYLAGETGRITNTYIPGEEYSFTIIAFPLPAIGADFEAIFQKTVELNTLDYELYQQVQQKLIDVLDQGYGVHITGRGSNRTDLTVMLHPLEDPAKETIFENCVADVNIPVGEVFTSPVLKGTNGLLHVSRVYLGELCYQDLEMTFTDGMVTDYGCSNFSDPEEGKRYILQNVLYRHDSLPMGEFAIGTNTLAYRMARDYQIADRLPILIAEKTGPHFAVGDTCYSHAEDVPMYNRDGKEVVARENEISALRKEEETKAYFNCHTDITIPYDELGDITVLCRDGRNIPVITGGRFVVPGTELLNEALDES